MAQTLSFNGRRRVRKFFGKIPEVAEMPNLIEVQKASYDQFLMVEEPKGGRPYTLIRSRLGLDRRCPARGDHHGQERRDRPDPHGGHLGDR